MTGKLVHGHTRSNSKTYRAWSAMLQRCDNPNTARYERYGGRGITVCIRWYKFENFLEDLGLAPEGHVLDRIDFNGHYQPGNCRWVTAKDSNRNGSRVVLSVEKAVLIRDAAAVWNGRMSLLCRRLSRELKVSPEAIRGVLRGNWKD
jgi:hypothetical protein